MKKFAVALTYYRECGNQYLALSIVDAASKEEAIGQKYIEYMEKGCTKLEILAREVC